MRYVDLDFETASSVDLKLAGAAAYSEDPTTEILCLSVTIDDVPAFCWRPGDDTAALRQLAEDPNCLIVVHGAQFEQAIWRNIMVKDFGLPPLPVERFEDTMATCAWKAWPLALEKAMAAARMPVQKDMEGRRLTLSLSRLDKKTGMYPERTPAVIQRVGEYCDVDVVGEVGLRKRIGLLSQQWPQERGIWLLDQKINQRGVRLDLDFVRQAQLVVDRATKPLLAEFRELTDGVNPGQVAAVIAWAETQGVTLDNLQKGYLAEVLDATENTDDAGYESNAGEEDDLREPRPILSSPTVRRALQIRSMLGSASIKKLARMRACVGSDGRARGLLQYHAANTGRWGGRLLQPQNFPRGTLKVSPEEAVDAIMSGDPEYVEMVLGAPAIECVASSLRHALIADPGKLFLVGDFAGIEARIVLALAGQHDKTALMAAGHDAYFDLAETMHYRPHGYYVAEAGGDYEKAKKMFLVERQQGKGGVLGCGFQCGPANFNNKFLGGKDFALAFRTVEVYRNYWAPKVPLVWYALERAALEAVRHGSGEAYGVEYRHEGEWLTARLPSGWQKIWYPEPRLFRDEDFDKDAWRYNAYKGGRLSQVKAYGGLLTENAVQGLARGLLVASMMRLERAGHPIVLTVHDEVVCEVDEDRADVDAFADLMAEPTPWADRIGIPISVEAWAGERYRK